MANKDGEHPEFDDLNFSEDELSDAGEGGSDALNFSEIDSGGSNLFEFSGIDSAGTSSLELSSLDDEPAMEMDLVAEEEPALDVTAAIEPDQTPLADPKGKKAKKEKTPKVKKEKPPKEKVVKEKKVKEKTVKEKKPRTPRSPSDKPGLLVEAQKASPFTVMLFVSAIALFFAVFLLLLEWFNYGFTLGA